MIGPDLALPLFQKKWNTWFGHTFQGRGERCKRRESLPLGLGLGTWEGDREDPRAKENISIYFETAQDKKY